MFNNFLLCCLLLFNYASRISFCETKDDLEKNIIESNICGRNGYVIIATIDGHLSSIDFESGKKCWTTVLDKEGLFSSSLYKLEVWENETRVTLIPSLDGALFRYDKIKLEPLPFNAELFLSQSASLDQSTHVTGGKFKVIFGIHQHSGEVFYSCSVNGCRVFSEVSTPDALVVEMLIQSVSAIDSLSAEQKWHFKVAEIQIKVMNSELPDKESLNIHHKGNNSAVVPLNEDFNNEIGIKISLQKGYAARKHPPHNFVWMYKTQTPIIDVWFVKEKALLLDPFADEKEFFKIDSPDGENAALLFLGSYKNEFFVKQSKKLKSRNMYDNALTKPATYKAFCRPLQINSNSSENASSNTQESTGVVLADPNFRDIGFYFYIDFSVLDNETHCVVDFKYPKVFERLVDYVWMKFFTISFVALACLGCAFFQHRSHMEKQFTSEGTSTTESSSAEKVQEYISRFHKDFELISILGKGGFGVVMEAKNVIDDCKYAVKRIKISPQGRSETKEEFVLREVKALAKLDHPGIVRYFNSWVEYPPIGWQEQLDESSNISFREPYSYSGDHEGMRSSSMSSEFVQRGKLNLSSLVRKNPLNPFPNVLDSSNDFLRNNDIQFPQRQLSSDFSSSSSDTDHTSSSSSDSDRTSGSSSEETASDSSIQDKKFKDHMSSDDSSDDSIVFSYQPDALNSLENTNFQPQQESLSDEEEDIYVPLFQSKNHYESFSRILKETFMFDDSFDSKTIDYYNNNSSLSHKEVFHHLMLINRNLAYPMHISHLQRLYTILPYGEFDFGISGVKDKDWTNWISLVEDIPQSEVQKTVEMLQTWLISVLIHMQSAKSGLHENICSNMCNILWDICFSFEKNHRFEKDCRKVRLFNSKLSFSMKLSYLQKLKPFLFHVVDEESNNNEDTQWESVFYHSNDIIFTTNLYLFRIWLISMLCYFCCERDITDMVVYNFYYILFKVNEKLSQTSLLADIRRIVFRYGSNLFLEPGNVYNKYSYNHNRIDFSVFKNVKLFEKRDSRKVEESLPECVNTLECNDECTNETEFSNCDNSSLKKNDMASQYHMEANDSFLYIQMQLCRRDNLRKWMDFNYHERDYDDYMSIFTQIVDAIEYVHAQGLMHRDLKPSNIYFSLEGLVKIGDFGLATHFEVKSEKESSSSKLQAHTSECGTELYMSPEQSSKKVYDFKTDIFPLGIILYELIVPFYTHFERQKAIIAARIQEFSPKFTEKYADEAMLAHMLLERDPKNRPTASEIKSHPVCQKYLKSKM